MKLLLARSKELIVICELSNKLDFIQIDIYVPWYNFQKDFGIEMQMHLNLQKNGEDNSLRYMTSRQRIGSTVYQG